MNILEIREQAEKELREEEYRREVEKVKQKLRQRKWSIWDRIIPFKIVIVRKEV